MNESTLRQVVAEWLEETDLPELIRREVETPDLKRLKNILAIVGPRRAGKTFLMYQLVKELLADPACTLDDILFIDFEDYRLAEFVPSDIEKLLTIFRQLTGKLPTYLFFDEVQRLPDWSRILRTFHNQKKYRIVVSGSNSDLLTMEIATELRGRYDDLLLLPFSFRELLNAMEIPVTRTSFHTSKRGLLLKAFDAYLATGGFPEVLELKTPAEKRRLLQNYFRTVFYRDIIERFNIRAKYLLDAIMNDCLNLYGDRFSVSRFERQLNAAGRPGSKRTIANYLHYVEQSFFVITADRFSWSARKRIMNPKKIYLMDVGFTALSTEFSENKGKLLENVVAIDLFRRQQKMFYFKERKECDFVITQGQRAAQAIQVCWELNSRNQERELSGLRAAVETLNIAQGLVLTYNQEDEAHCGGRTYPVMPVWKWLVKPHD